jgi:hypothetical protein
LSIQNFAGVELTELTQKLLKSYCDETGGTPKEVLNEAVQKFLDRQKKDREFEELIEALGDNMLTVQVTLFLPFANFIEKYRQFFGSPGSLEDFCRQAVYEKCNTLYSDLTQFADNKTHLLDPHAWYEKHSHLSITSSAPEDESE